MAYKRGLTFYGLLDAVMEGVRLRLTSRQYTRLPGDGEPEDEMLMESALSRRKRRLPSCCICCWTNKSLICKAVGIPIFIFLGWLLVKLAIWAFSDRPTGLENMPAFSASLGCATASHMYNNSINTVRIPFGRDKPDHSFTVYGGIVGTLTLVDGEPDDTDVKYEFTIKSNDPSLLDSHSLLFRYADVAPDGVVQKSQFLITSPTITEESESCLRYDIKLFVPPSLKKLNIATHAVTHLKVDPGSNIHLETFYATLYESSTNNLILPHQSLRADTIGLEVYRGWIVGDVSISQTTSIKTQRGDGVANVKVHPLAPVDRHNPEKAVFWTVTGAGRSDFSWLGDSTAPKRPIEADHKSSMNGDVYLTYRNANFKGLISLDSKSHTTWNVNKIQDADNTENWTHWAGDRSGPDRLTAESRGWTGLYF